MSIVDKIVRTKQEEVRKQQKALPPLILEKIISDRTGSTRDFLRKLKNAVLQKKWGIVAEIKKASPLGGVWRENFDPIHLARDLSASGATCLSIVTDIHFHQGNPSYLRQIKQAVTVPVLRKDYIIDPYQMLESRALGADAVTLIAGILDDAKLRDFTLMAHDLSMDVLIEVRQLRELERALKLPIRAVSVNSHQLHDEQYNPHILEEVRAALPEHCLLIYEGEEQSASTLKNLNQSGIYAYIINRALMQMPDSGAALNYIIENLNEASL